MLTQAIQTQKDWEEVAYYMLLIILMVMAMDSLIYYGPADIAAALDRLGARTRSAVVFTVAPKTPFLMAFWTLGKAFPRADRSPTMVPHAFETLSKATGGRLAQIDRVSRGFYISECLEYRP